MSKPVLGHHDLIGLTLAYRAASHSCDPSTNVGAVLRNAVGQHIQAHNQSIEPGRKLDQMADKAEKYQKVLHAEAGVVAKAARVGMKTSDGTMYVTCYACVECAKIMIGSGISRAVGDRRLLDLAPPRWRESIDKGVAMLEKAGVQCDWLDIGDRSLLTMAEPLFTDPLIPDNHMIITDGQIFRP
jgi:deoxycytidylate deaminase